MLIVPLTSFPAAALFDVVAWIWVVLKIATVVVTVAVTLGV